MRSRRPIFEVVNRARIALARFDHQAKHFFYAAGWKKSEPLWELVIRAKRLAMMTPLLEGYKDQGPAI